MRYINLHFTYLLTYIAQILSVGGDGICVHNFKMTRLMLLATGACALNVSFLQITVLYSEEARAGQTDGRTDGLQHEVRPSVGQRHQIMFV